jgi:hypothetical protein
MKKTLKTAVSALALTAALSGAANAGQAEIDEINGRYAVSFDALQTEIEDWKGEAPEPSEFEAIIDAEGTISWEITDFSFDIPEIIFKTREFSLDVPQFTWDRTGFSMDIPVTYMATTKVGEYPCFKGLKWYSCDMKMDVPQVKMVRKEFSLDLPQVSWGRTSFSMDIPEFYSKRVEIKMHLPQFKLESVSGQINVYEQEGEEFAARAEQLGKAQETEIKAVVRIELATQKTQVQAQFDAAIVALDKAIADLKSAGANPAAVSTSDGVIDLFAMRQEVLQKREKALNDITAQVNLLNA